MLRHGAVGISEWPGSRGTKLLIRQQGRAAQYGRWQKIMRYGNYLFIRNFFESVRLAASCWQPQETGVILTELDHRYKIMMCIWMILWGGHVHVFPLITTQLYLMVIWPDPSWKQQQPVQMEDCDTVLNLLCCHDSGGLRDWYLSFNRTGRSSSRCHKGIINRGNTVQMTRLFYRRRVCFAAGEMLL